MKRLLNLFHLRWFMLAGLILTLAAGQAHAADSTEKRNWEAAMKLFQDANGPTAWSAAASRFANFMKRYPSSEHYADAVVFQARALFEQKNYSGAIDLLAAQAPHAGTAADRFAYWTATAYARQTNYEAAADAFGKLVRENPASPLRLEAIFREAEARSKLGYWPRAIEELREPDGAFQQMARTNRSDELVVSGLLLLTEAELAQQEYSGARKTLSEIVMDDLRPELEWERQFLLCRVLLASGPAQAALDASTNLLTLTDGKPDLRAKSIMLQGEMRERLDQLPVAIQTYETNLNGDLPVEWQRQALLKIVELMLRLNQTGQAAQRLNDFLTNHVAGQNADFELLILGEIHLKQYYLSATGTNAPVDGTNFLSLAGTNFQQLINDFPLSAYLGKAELNRGWCLLAEGKIPESQMAFSNAVEHLALSEDQAVARFKLADIFYQQQNFAAAIENYSTIIERYGAVGAVRGDLFEQALYQIVRAGLAGNDLTAATDAMNKILMWFPDSLLGGRSMLLVGEAQMPGNARVVFEDFSKRFPESPLLPEVKLAEARTYEQETNWTAAISQYDAWVGTYSNSAALPRAEFARAWANYQAGNETNAFLLFTNFVARFATNDAARSNDLPALAQQWVGDNYWRQEDFQKAELSYKEIFNKWPESKLAFEARMMAGRAAMQSQSPQAAITYFTNLSSNPNCPPGLKAQALFASGDATMVLPAATADANYQEAMRIFHYLATTYTNSPIAALAWGRLGDCYYAQAAADPSQYYMASNAFTQVTESGVADVTTRSMAELRLGQTLEAMMRKSTGADQKSLAKLALDHLTNVLYGNNLRDNEVADMFWVKESGLEAAKLSEGLGEWAQAVQFYQRLENMIPPLQTALEKKISKARENLALGKN